MTQVSYKKQVQMKFNILAIMFCCASYMATAQITVYDIDKATTSSNPYYLTPFNDKVYFMANDKTSGQELWGIDNTTGGAFLVTDLNPGAANADLTKQYSGMKEQFAVAYVDEYKKDFIFFAANDGVRGNELYMYDGTNAPILVKEFVPGAQGLGDVLNMAAGNGYIFFCEDFKGIWVYNIKTKVANLLPGTQSLGQVKELVFHNGSIYTDLYRSTGPGGGFHLWHYNPVTGDSGIVQSNLEHIAGITPIGNKLYYTAGGSMRAYEKNKPLKTIAPITSNSFYKGWGVFNNKLYFTSENNDIFEYDPATDKTKNVIKHSNYWASRGASNFTQFGNKMYFAATDATLGEKLWQWDGTNPPQLVPGVNVGMTSTSPFYLRAAKDGLYYVAQSSDGREVHRYNPNSASVKNLAFAGDVQVYPNPTSSAVTLAIQLNAPQTLSVELYNTTGQKVYSGQQVLYAQGNNKVQLDMHNLPAGSYFYYIRNTSNATLAGGKIEKL